MIRTLIYIELEKLFRRNRTYIGIIAILIIVLVIQGGMMMSGPAILEFISRSLQENFILQGNLMNGYLVAFLSVNSMWIHVPILIVIVTGELISGEEASGTFRLYLSRPVSRTAVVLAKFIAAISYAALLVILLGVLSLGLGVLVFGTGDIIVFFDTVNILPEKELPGRFALSFGYGMISMCLVAALSFVFSASSGNSLAPILYTMAIIILFTVISNFGIGIFNTIKPFLFTTYMNKWQAFFEYEPDWPGIGFSLLVLGAHIAFLLGMSIFIFERKDITS